MFNSGGALAETKNFSILKKKLKWLFVDFLAIRAFQTLSRLGTLSFRTEIHFFRLFSRCLMAFVLCFNKETTLVIYKTFDFSSFCNFLSYEKMERFITDSNKVEKTWDCLEFSLFFSLECFEITGLKVHSFSSSAFFFSYAKPSISYQKKSKTWFFALFSSIFSLPFLVFSTRPI